MAPAPAAQLVVAISSRALFDFEEENQVFETADDRAYIELQLARLDAARQAGRRVPAGAEAARLQRRRRAPRRGRHPVAQRSGVGAARVPLGARLGLAIERGVFTRGRAPYSYLRPLNANLFLSANADDVKAALEAGYPGGARLHAIRRRPTRILTRCASRSTATRCCSPTRPSASTSRRASRRSRRTRPTTRAGRCRRGPFKPLLEALHRLQVADDSDKVR